MDRSVESVEAGGGGESMTGRPWCIVFCAGLVVGQTASGQSVRSLVNSGNDFYEKQQYTDAEVNYRKALEKDASLLPGRYNLGSALHKEGKYQEAVSEYETLLRPTTGKETQADIHYNIGNSYMKEQQYQQAVNSYIESLKLNPSDADAKYNLSYALEKLRQQQQQQKQNKDKDKDKDKNKDQNKKDQQKQQQKQQDQKNQQQQQNQEQQRQQRQEKQMSRADAERILQVLRNNEKEVQKKLRARTAVRPKSEKDW
jgi:Ca-activated chloride channel homolog